MSPVEKEGKEATTEPSWVEIAAPSLGLLTALLIVVGTVWATTDAVNRRLVSRSDGLILGVVIGSIAAAVALGSLIELVRKAWLIFATGSETRQESVSQPSLIRIGQAVVVAAGVAVTWAVVVTTTPHLPDQVELNVALYYEDPVGLPPPSPTVDAVVDAGYFAVDDTAADILDGLPRTPTVYFVLNDESSWDIAQLNKNASSLNAGDVAVSLDSFFSATGLSASDIDIGAFNQFRETDLFSDLASKDAQLFVLDSFQAFPVTSGGG